MKKFYKIYSIKKMFIKFLYKFIVIVSLIYLIIILILIYLGSIKTLQLQHLLKKKNTNIVVSFTTTPHRIEDIKPVLKSIERQSIKPNKIYVNVPWKFKRTNQEYVIPNWLKIYPNIIINRTQDYGPATKLIATLEKETDPSTIIITVDDDTIYPKHMVRDLVQPYFCKNYKETYHTGAVFSGIGLNALFDAFHSFYVESIFLNNHPGLLVVGIGGVAYKREFFKEDIFSFIKSLPLSCFLSDDLTISMYLLARGVNIIKVNGVSYNHLFKSDLLKRLPSSTTEDALSKGASGIAHGGNEANYCYCLDHLLQQNNTKKFSQIIFQRSELIHQIVVNDINKIITQQFYYTYLLNHFIKNFPFVEDMVLALIE